jgi:hypothetical protein
MLQPTGLTGKGSSGIVRSLTTRNQKHYGGSSIQTEPESVIISYQYLNKESRWSETESKRLNEHTKRLLRRVHLTFAEIPKKINTKVLSSPQAWIEGKNRK